MEFDKTVHFAILTQCLPAQFTAFPSAHDPGRGKLSSPSSINKYLNIYYGMYAPCLIVIGK